MNAKHEQAALLLASGQYTHKEIAEQVGCHAQYLVQLKRRVDFQHLIAKYQERLVSESFEQVKRELALDAPKNLRFLVETRDGKFRDDKDTMSLRLKASQVLFERQVPKRDEGDKGGITIVINQETMAKVEKAAQEVEEFEDDSQS